MNAEVRHQPALRVLGMRHIGPYNQIGSTFQKLMGSVNTEGIRPKAILAAYLDDPSQVPAEQLRSDACVVVADDFPDRGEGATAEGDLHTFILPAGDYAVGTHIGPYSGLGDAWQALFDWMTTHGQIPDESVCYEVYLDDMSKNPDPATLRTELYAPVR